MKCTHTHLACINAPHEFGCLDCWELLIKRERTLYDTPGMMAGFRRVMQLMRPDPIMDECKGRRCCDCPIYVVCKVGEEQQ